MRSYQRVFRPDRRIYAVDGRALPIPGGLPLRWLAATTIALLAGLVLAALSVSVIIAAGTAAAWSMLRPGRPRLVAPAAAMTVAACLAAGLALRLMDWPLRLVLVPAVLATVATQLAPDGRGAHRFAWSWLYARLAGRRRLGDALPAPGDLRAREWVVRVAHDAHQPLLRRARIIGPARVRFSGPILAGRRRRGWLVRPVSSGAGRRGGLMLDRLELGDGERAEIRP